MWPGNWERYDRQQKLGVRDTDYVVIANTHTHTIVMITVINKHGRHIPFMIRY